MSRKRLTQIFPWLLPWRKKQRRWFFYLKMRFDKRRYAKTLATDKTLPYQLFSSSCALYNHSTGFSMTYQENKVFNLKLVAKQMDGLLIYPGETFSFWQLARYADKHTPYKDGLTVENGKLTVSPGGGLCQMSNSLFWLFLHTPLTIIERHGHGVKEFPEPNNDEIKGVDATIAEGWLDLKVTNNTDNTYQIRISFDEAQITTSIYSLHHPQLRYEVNNGELHYWQQGDTIQEEIAVVRQAYDYDSQAPMGQELLYTNQCIITYQLPEGTIISRKEPTHEQVTTV